MYDTTFQHEIARRIDAEKLAREILDVELHASQRQLKSAWRRACKKLHPDRRPEEFDAGEDFNRLRLAYLCLSRGERCDDLIEAAGEPDAGTSGKCHWSYFLSWRDRFF